MLRLTLSIFCLFFILGLHAQVTFKKGSLIKKSFSFKPNLIKSEDAFYIIEPFGRNITQISLDADMQETGTYNSILPDEKKLIESFVYDHKLFVILKNSQAKENSYELYRYDPDTRVFSTPLVTMDVPDYGNGEWLFVDVNMDREKDLSGLTFHVNSEKPTESIAKVFMLSPDLDKIEWQYQMDVPEIDLNFSEKEIDLLVPLVLSRNKFILSYSQDGKKEYQLTKMEFAAKEGEISLVSTVVKEYPKEKVFPKYEDYDSITKGSRVITDEHVIHKFVTTFDQETGRFTLELQDDNDEILEELEIKSRIEHLAINKAESQIDSYLYESEDPRYDYTLNIVLHTQNMKIIKTEDLGPLSGNNYLIQLKIKNNSVLEESIVNLGNPRYGITFFEEMAIKTKTLDYAKNGQFENVEEKDVFDVFITVGDTISGFTYHYNIEGTFYSLHSEYALGSMNAQLVEWVFPEE